MAHQRELSQGQRFEFGENWSLFLRELNEERILLAEQSLLRNLGVTTLSGRSFLDIGSGSGLFSLAARRLGAHVHSFDYDPQSVACTRQLRDTFNFNDGSWIVEEGSVLDSQYLKSLGHFDIVYSWGVLHHTGNMWSALSNASLPVAQKGLFFISIYNDIGVTSRRWLAVKRAYNKLPKGLRWIIWIPSLIKFWGPTIVRDALKFQPFRTWNNYSRIEARGMTAFRDLIDWVGGLPYEVAKPEQIFDFFTSQGFTMCRLKTSAGGIGCNEYVFHRNE